MSTCSSLQRGIVGAHPAQIDHPVLGQEITGKIAETAGEVANLESVYAGDKVAEVYLQGLDKIGSYIRSKGAYAHPNSIKLLLTFFYDFEKAVSSPNISGEEITRILKADIRKFKILQYQIALGEDQTKERSWRSAPPCPRRWTAAATIASCSRRPFSVSTGR